MNSNLSFQRAAVAALSHGNNLGLDFSFPLEELTLISNHTAHQNSCPQPSTNGVQDKSMSLVATFMGTTVPWKQSRYLFSLFHWKS